MRNFLIFFALISCYGARTVIAQDQCTRALSDAEDKYEQGRLYEIPEIIHSCLEEGFSKEQKIRAYRLLTLTYLFLNYYEEADDSYLELLRLSPEFEINDEIDPMEIIIHHDKFTTRPIYYLTLGKVGLNMSFADVLLDYSISQSFNSSDNYSPILGFQIGFGAEMVLFQNLHLSGEFFVTNRNLHLKDTHWNFYTTDMDISHTDFEIPIMLKYNFFRGKVNPFVAGGISPSFLIESSIRNLQGVYRLRSGIDGEIEEEFPVQSRPEIGTTEMKRRLNYSILFGGGVNYKIGLNYLVFEVRFSKGMLNVTDEENRWREDFSGGRELKFPPGHVDDDFKIDNLSFSIGFVKPLYKPRKRK